MKRLSALILALTMLCTALCGCDVRDGYIEDRDSDKGVITDGKKDTGTTEPMNTAVPGSQTVTP